MKYNYNDHFDLLTIKHEYLKDTSHVEEGYIKEYLPIAHITANIMFERYEYLFERAGFNSSDIKSLSMIYMVGYLARYGFRYNRENYEKFADKFRSSNNREPDDKEIKRAERNEIITFIRHKLGHCSTLCERKSRNIRVARNKIGYYSKVDDLPYASPEAIMEDHEKHGYRKVTISEFKEARKQARRDKNNKIFDKNGQEIIVTEYFDPGLSEKEYLELVLGCDTMYTTDPESLLISMQKQRIDERNRNKFNQMASGTKVEILQQFINQNKGNKALRDELAGAKKLLKKYNFWNGHI